MKRPPQVQLVLGRPQFRAQVSPRRPREERDPLLVPKVPGYVRLVEPDRLDVPRLIAEQRLRKRDSTLRRLSAHYLYNVGDHVDRVSRLNVAYGSERRSIEISARKVEKHISISPDIKLLQQLFVLLPYPK